jgi:secreted trypsin-like serine protease
MRHVAVMSRCLFVLSALFFTGSGHGIIIRHDVGQAAYETRSIDYPAIFYLERQGVRKVCVATLIARQWALTAAHCTEETSLGVATARGGTFAVEVAGQAREIDLVVKHPRYQQGAVDDVDLALIRFKAPLASPSPIALNMAKDELSKVVTIVGWGYFGIGTLGRQYADGRMRYATNRISQSGRYLRYRFDDPREAASASLPTEGMLGLGDSGGPALITTASGSRLAGVAVGQLLNVDYDEETQGRYGAIAIYERVSSHITWIESVINSSE